MLRGLLIMLWTLHGIGHAAGVLAAWTKIDQGFKTDVPWLLPGRAMVTGTAGRLWSVFWLAAMVLIVSSTVGLMSDAEWWLDVALYGAAVSLVAIVPWARTVVSGALAGTLISAAAIGVLRLPALEGVLAWIAG